MEEKEIKSFIEVDPEKCSLDELKNEMDRLEKLTEFFESKQMAIKLFINSVYGATASPFFIGHNVDVAEAITLQGQDLNHFSENCLNRYFKGIFQNDAELHKKLGIDSELAKKIDLNKGRVTQQGKLDGKEFNYLEGNVSGAVAGDTDSVSGNSKLNVDDKKTTIEKLFNKIKKENFDIVNVLSDNQEIVTSRKKHFIKTYDEKTNSIIEAPIKYIMRHKVTKNRYIIRTKSGKTVSVTGDHSIMVIRDNKLQSIKTKDILKTDKLITL